MPATLTAPHMAPVLPLPVPRPEPIRRTGTGRCCPVCAEPRCADAEFCRAYFADRDWINCLDCGGTGYDTSEFQIWCPTCGGAKVVEAGGAGMSPAVITPLTDATAPPVQPPRTALRASDTPLSRARVARGWSQRKVVRALRLLAESWGWEVAAESSLTVQISRWENGVNRPSQTYQVLLCALFRATPQDLGFTRTGNTTLADRIDALEHLVSDLAAQLETAVAA